MPFEKERAKFILKSCSRTTLTSKTRKDAIKGVQTNKGGRNFVHMFIIILKGNKAKTSEIGLF